MIFDFLNWDWPGFGYDIFIELLGASIVFVASTLFFTVLLTRLYRKSVKNVTKIHLENKDDDKVIKCFSAHSGFSDTKENLEYGFFFEDMSYSLLTNYLLSIHKKTEFEFKFSPLNKYQVNQITNTLKGDIVLFGGPNHNLLTNKILGLKPDYSNVPFYFSIDESGKEDATLFSLDDNHQVKACYVPLKDDNEEYYCKDYGLIINIKNPYDPANRLIAFIGCRSIGVYGATMYFCKHSKEVKKKTKKYDEYALIIKCEGNKYNVEGDPTLIEAIPLNSIKKEDILTSHIVDSELIDVSKITPNK